MRVLHWNPNLLGGGAVANSTVALAEAQARLGAEVLLCSAEHEGEPVYGFEVPADQTLHVWRPRGRVSVSGICLRGLRRRDAQRIRALDPDIVHVHGEFNPDNLRLPGLLDSPLILAPRGAFHPGVFAKRRTLSKLAYARLARLLLYRRVASFHALSPEEATHVRAFAPRADVYVAPNPILENASPLGRARPRSDGALRLIFVGRLDVFTKGLDVLLATVAAARHRLARPIELTLVGPDSRGGRTALQRHATELGLAAEVDFTGALTPSQVKEQLADSDLYIQLSRHEAFGASIREALLTPLPVIITRGVGIASFTEIASLPHVAVVPLNAQAAAHAIVSAAIRLPDLRAEAKRERTRVAELFSWRRVAETHFAAYRRAMCVSRDRHDAPRRRG